MINKKTQALSPFNNPHHHSTSIQHWLRPIDTVSSSHQQQTPTQHGLLIKYGGVQWITRFFYKKMVYKKLLLDW